MEKCKYCGNEAFYFLFKNKIPCCSETIQRCPEIINRNSNGCKESFNRGRKDTQENFVHYTHREGFIHRSKGKNKETSEEIRKTADTLKTLYKNGDLIPSFKGQKHSEETYKKWKENPNMGGLREGSGRGKKGWYKGFYCRSTWELAWLVYNLEHGTKVSKCEEYFEYVFEGKKHRYYPDFKIEEDYIEIKGYREKNVQSKIDQFPQNKKLILVEGKKQIKQYIDYCSIKYSKEFWKMLYE